MRDFFSLFSHHIAQGDPDKCWIWTGPVISRGYGSFCIRGEKTYAHRAAYEYANGQGSAEGLVVRHTCDNPPCVNPNHLLVGTHRDNAADMIQRGRGNPPIGERSPFSVLKADNVTEARRLARSGMPISEIIKIFPVNHAHMRKILLGRKWAHVPGTLVESEICKAPHHKPKPGQSASKMTPEKVLAVKRALREGERIIDIAKQYGVSNSLIGGIKSGKVWSHVF